MSDLSSDQKVHDLKVWPEFFGAIIRGEKQFEIRRNDRGYKVGDVLLLREFRPYFHDLDHPKGEYTGEQVYMRVQYMTDFEQKEGFVVMGITNE